MVAAPAPAGRPGISGRMSNVNAAVSPPERVIVRVQAATLEELFVEAARALLNLAEARVKPDVRLRRSIDVRGDDAASLLLAWLRQLLEYGDLEDRVFYDFTIVTLSARRLQAEAAGGLREYQARRLTLELGLEILIRQTGDGFDTSFPVLATEGGG